MEECENSISKDILLDYFFNGSLHIYGYNPVLMGLKMQIAKMVKWGYFYLSSLPFWMVLFSLHIRHGAVPNFP